MTKLQCKICLFDSDNFPEIKLNDAGVCEICQINLETIEQTKNDIKNKSIEDRWKEIRSARKSKYDCIIGISGGIDSSYLVLMAKKAGINALLVHVDGGWNNEIAISNIKKIIDWSGYDYHSCVLNWSEIQDAQRAFLMANVLDIDLPFENALLKQLYTIANKYNVKTILFGYNAFTEGFLPVNYTHYKLDKKNIISIHKRFGKRKINYNQFIGTFEHFYITRLKKIQFQYPLNWFEYNKEIAKKELEETFKWIDYGGKHHENLFTQFYQEVILPKKFKVYKNIAHLSMLICSGQLSKDQATIELNNKTKIPSAAKEYFLKKLNISNKQFDDYVNSPAIDHRNFKSDLDIYDRFKPIYRFCKKIIGFSWFKGKFGH